MVPLSDDVERERKAPAGIEKSGAPKGWLARTHDLKPVHAYVPWNLGSAFASDAANTTPTVAIRTTPSIVDFTVGFIGYPLRGCA
jgi:hypothetical protein